MYFAKNEKAIIENFYKKLSEIGATDILLLIWETGKIKATFDTCFDDFDEINENDEFTSFVFQKIEITGTPPVEITEANFFIVNYHNFPLEILFNGIKIN